MPLEIVQIHSSYMFFLFVFFTLKNVVVSKITFIYIKKCNANAHLKNDKLHIISTSFLYIFNMYVLESP